MFLHPMTSGRKDVQTVFKLAFDTVHVDARCRAPEKRRLKSGAIHRADGHYFANADDPARNSIAVSSRAFVRQKHCAVAHRHIADQCPTAAPSTIIIGQPREQDSTRAVTPYNRRISSGVSTSRVCPVAMMSPPATATVCVQHRITWFKS